MKYKKIPKFDQKAWDEKQAKSSENEKRGIRSPDAEEANGGGGSVLTTGWKNLMDKHTEWLKKAQEDALIFGTGNFPTLGIDPAIGSGIGPNTSPPGITSGAALRAKQALGFVDLLNQYGVDPKTFNDPYDKYLFGGEDGDRDKDLRLPQGVHPADWYSYDPAFKQEERCCKPEDKVNVGFMQDKWACKVCGKDM